MKKSPSKEGEKQADKAPDEKPGKDEVAKVSLYWAQGGNLSKTVYLVNIATVELLCALCAPLESAFIKLCTIIWKFDPYARILKSTCHSTPMCKNLCN